MKILKYIYLLLLIASIINSTSTEAKKISGSYFPNYVGNSLMYGVGRRDVFHHPNFLLSWVLDVKFDSLKKTGILGDELQAGKFDFIRDIFHSFKNLPSSVSRIHMYGDGKAKNTTMLMFGDVNATWLEDFIVNDLYNGGNKKITYNKKVLMSGLQDITKLSIQSVDSNQGAKANKIYYSSVRPGLYVISSNMYEIRRWRDYPRSVFYYRHWPRQDALFSFQMDVEDTIENMKSDGVTKINMLKSKVFNESKDINIAIREDENNIFIGSYLTTKEAGQAEELKTLLNTILSDEGRKFGNSLKDKFIENLSIVREDNSLLLTSVFSKDALQKTTTKK